MFFSNILRKGVTEADRDYWLQVIRTILKIQKERDPQPSNYCLNFECHSLCLALAWAIPGLKLVHGCYLGLDIYPKQDHCEYDVRNCRHSWLETPDGAIIDPYPVGLMAINAILIGKSSYDCFGRALYHVQPSVIREIKYAKVYRQARVLLKLTQ